jgi:hypothetical protein
VNGNALQIKYPELIVWAEPNRLYASGKFKYENKGEKKQHADRQGSELRSFNYAEGGSEERTSKKVEDRNARAQKRECAQESNFSHASCQ